MWDARLGPVGMAGVATVAVATVATAAWAAPARLEVTSDAFPDQGSIPTEFTCRGAAVSPPLRWSDVPDGTRSIAVLVEDPDAPKGTFTHWLVTGLPPSTRSLDRDAVLPAGAVATRNDQGTVGYTPPCPPSGTHHYHFQVFALDTRLPAPMTVSSFETAIQGHVLALGELVGTVSHQAR